MIEKYFINLPLSHSSVTVNGMIIENEIPGFRVSSVEGRENISASIDEIEVGYNDGNIYRKKKDKPKDIMVYFNLVCSTMEFYNESIVKINSYFHNGESKIIFNDDPDFYYIGTTSDITYTKINASGTEYRACQGVITLRLNKPYKYSVNAYEINAKNATDGQTVTIQYRGTKKAYPVIETTFTSDSGYVAFINEEGKILQFGSPDEVDGHKYKASENMCSVNTFTSAYNDTVGINAMHPNHVSAGTLNLSDNRLYLNTLTNNKESKWNYGMRTFTLPADSNGHKGAKNFYCYMNHWFETGLVGQTGEQSIAFLDANNNVICGYNIFKSDMVGNTACFEFWANNKCIKSMQFIPSAYDYHNPFNEGRGHNDIRKEGSKITFYWWGSYPSYDIPELADSECVKIQVAFSQYGKRNLGGQYVTRNYLRSLDFTKMHVDKYSDDPNKFANGDKLIIDCEKGTVTHKGLNKPGLGSIGNEWEEFYLKQGSNTIKCVNSSWSTTKPKFKISYKEAYL